MACPDGLAHAIEEPGRSLRQLISGRINHALVSAGSTGHSRASLPLDLREDGAHDLRHGSSSRCLSGWLASDFVGTVNRPPRRSIVRTQRVASNPPNKPCHKVDVTNSICNCKGVYSIEFSEDAVEDLVAVRAFDQGRILEAIEKRLGDRPTVETRHRKMLWGLTPAFEAVPPIWELRVGEYRVFYDVDEREKKVYVRAIKRKPPHRTTEEIL